MVTLFLRLAGNKILKMFRNNLFAVARRRYLLVQTIPVLRYPIVINEFRQNTHEITDYVRSV